jgi:hypothetical protein
MTRCIWCLSEVDRIDSKPLCVQCHVAIQRNRAGPSWKRKPSEDARNPKELETPPSQRRTLVEDARWEGER